MRLSFENADWKRVFLCYLGYAGFVYFMAWPTLCLWQSSCGTPFRWLWGVYFASSANPSRFLIVVLMEFVISILVGMLVRFKPIDRDEDDNDDTATREFRNKVGVIIPCHKSAGVIRETLERALLYFAPENIVVMDNGRSEKPLDNCLEEVRKLSSTIIYKWVPVGHKAVALMLGSRLLPDHVEYLLLMDDDVLIPKNMRFDSFYFDDDSVSAVAYSIAGCGPDNAVESMNQIQRFQDFEFKLADTYRCFVSQFSTISFAHGAVGLWRRDRFTEIYSAHPGLPIGEDGWAGRLNLLAGYTMKQDSGPVFCTEVPPNLVPEQWWLSARRLCKTIHQCKRDSSNDKAAGVIAGYGSPDLFNQRARRWDMNSPRRLFVHLRLFFTYGWDQYRKLPFHKALIFNLIFRLSILRGAWALFGAVVYVSYLVRILHSSDPIWVIKVLGGLYALQVIKYLLFNFCVWRRRRDLRVSLKTMCLMPCYRKIMVLYRCYGYFRSIFKYVPLVKSPDRVLGKRDDLVQAWPLVRDQNEDDLLLETDDPELTLPQEEESCIGEMSIPYGYEIDVLVEQTGDGTIQHDLEGATGSVGTVSTGSVYTSSSHVAKNVLQQSILDIVAAGVSSSSSAHSSSTNLDSFIDRMEKSWDKALENTLADKDVSSVISCGDSELASSSSNDPPTPDLQQLGDGHGNDMSSQDGSFPIAKGNTREEPSTQTWSDSPQFSNLSEFGSKELEKVVPNLEVPHGATEETWSVSTNEQQVSHNKEDGTTNLLQYKHAASPTDATSIKSGAKSIKNEAVMQATKMADQATTDAFSSSSDRFEELWDTNVGLNPNDGSGFELNKEATIPEEVAFNHNKDQIPEEVQFCRGEPIPEEVEFKDSDDHLSSDLEDSNTDGFVEDTDNHSFSGVVDDNDHDMSQHLQFLLDRMKESRAVGSTLPDDTTISVIQESGTSPEQDFTNSIQVCEVMTDAGMDHEAVALELLLFGDDDDDSAAFEFDTGIVQGTTERDQHVDLEGAADAVLDDTEAADVDGTNLELLSYVDQVKKSWGDWGLPTFSLAESLNLSAYVERMDKLWDASLDYTLADNEGEANDASARATAIATDEE